MTRMTALDRVTWQVAGEPLGLDELTAAEEQLEVVFPAALRAIYRRHDGGYIRPSLSFEYRHPKLGAVGTLLSGFHPIRSISDADRAHLRSISSLISLLRRDGRIPNGVVPFGNCGGSHRVCLDVRSVSSVAPSIVYLDQGLAPNVIALAPSFDAFLSMLTIDDE